MGIHVILLVHWGHNLHLFRYIEFPEVTIQRMHVSEAFLLDLISSLRSVHKPVLAPLADLASGSGTDLLTPCRCFPLLLTFTLSAIQTSCP